jgi:hypothetical protein
MKLIKNEQEIVKTLFKDAAVKDKQQSIVYWCDIGKDLTKKPYQDIVFLNTKKEGAFFISYETTIELGDLLQALFLNYAEEGKVFSDVEFEINSDESYTSRYWFDEERLYREEYEGALRNAKDFNHAMASYLINHQLSYLQIFKRKFERIIWTFGVENGVSYYELYSINKKNQKLPIELEEKYDKTVKELILEHYEVTQNGILKDVWKPYNKIVISIPPNGYLNENEDIAYYLDDVKLEKGFFLRGY